VPVSAPPQSPEQDELEALIEEARRRARGRRRRYGAALALALLAAGGLYAGFGHGGGGDSTSVAGAGPNPSSHTQGAQRTISACRGGPASRYHLWTSGIPCSAAAATIAGFSGHMAISYLNARQPGVFLDNGWACWAEPQWVRQPFGVQNACLRGAAAMIFLETDRQAKRNSAPAWGTRRSDQPSTYQLKHPKISPCPRGDPSGPNHLSVKGISCPAAMSAIASFPRQLAGTRSSRQARVVSDHGWECWTQRAQDQGSPAAQNVCLRGAAAMVFFEPEGAGTAS
jgi:hypothetical protein